MRFALYLIACVRLYRAAKSGGLHYTAITSFGIPTAAIFVGLNRDAWMVSELAISSYVCKRESW